MNSPFPLAIAFVLSTATLLAQQATTTKASATPAPKFDAAAVKPLEVLFDRALDGYNAGNPASFFADFAKSARPAPTDKTWASLIAGYYRTEFGRVVSKKLSNGETVPDKDFGVLVYHAVCEKKQKIKLSANFTRENGALKIVQVRFEK